MTVPAIFGGLTKDVQYRCMVNGATVATRWSGSAGAVTFTAAATTGDSVRVEPVTTYNVPTDFRRWFTALICPSPGEDFPAPGELRLVAAGGQGNSSDIATSMEFYIGDTLIATVSAPDSGTNVFRGRVTGVAAGTHRVRCRAIFSDGLGGTFYNESFHHEITVTAYSYARTITLPSNTVYTDALLDGGTLAGSAGALVKLDAAGHLITGNAATALAFQYVHVYNLGATSGVSSTYGLDLVLSGNYSFDHVKFFGCSPMRVTCMGTATASWKNSLLCSNSRNPLGLAADYSGGDANGSWPSLVLNGNSSGAKVFEANDVHAGWVEFISPSWTVGGDTVDKANIVMGPRVGLYGATGSGNTASTFSGTVKFNFIYHIYYGGWSQGAAFEWYLQSPLLEHNIVMGSSWPARGLGGIVRYNLILGDTWAAEGFSWLFAGPTTLSDTVDYHHNVVRCPVQFGRGGVWGLYTGTATVRNNTLDGVVAGAGDSLIRLGGDPVGGVMTVDSNICYRGSDYAVKRDAGTLTADYNCFSGNQHDGYNDRALQANDTTTAPAFAAVPAVFVPFDLKAVKARTKTVTAILADYRGYYTPTAVEMDNGNTAIYGANNPRGAIRRSGAGSNANDKFGTL